MPKLSHGILLDSRDGKSYAVVSIDSQTWMAQNLNYDSADGTSSWCYGNNPENCAIYGRLYDWDTAIKLCPAGWHLPSYADWSHLDSLMGGWFFAGTRLKAKSALWKENTGSDTVGFAALPGGGLGLGFGFGSLGSSAYWWTSQSNTDTTAVSQSMAGGNTFLFGYTDPRRFGMNVRCLKNAP